MEEILNKNVIPFKQGCNRNTIHLHCNLKKDNKIFYEHGNNKEELKTADYKTFEVIDSLPHFDLLAKDKKNVYYQGKAVKGINPKTFKIIKENFPPDKGPWKYGCGSSGYIIEDKGKQYELKEVF